VVLLVTGVLVDRSPTPDTTAAASSARPGVSTGTLGDVEVRATMSPAATGPSTVTIAMSDAAGEPFEGYEAPRARLSSDDVDLGDVPVQSVAPGSYAAQVVLPSPGTWRLQVSLRTTEFDNPVTTLEFTVEGS
jgi:copper transport protein